MVTIYNLVFSACHAQDCRHESCMYSFVKCSFNFFVYHQNGGLDIPSTGEDREGADTSTLGDVESIIPLDEKDPGGVVKFGWIKGVLVSSLTSALF